MYMLHINSHKKKIVDGVNIFILPFCKNKFLLWIFCFKFEWFAFHEVYLLFILFLECPYGTFGDGCQLKCRCYNDEQCNHINGKYPSGLCASGYKGDSCQIGKVFLDF